MNLIVKATAISIALTTAASAQEKLELTSAFGQHLPILGTAAVDFVEKLSLIHI